MSKAAVGWLIIGLALVVHTGCDNGALTSRDHDSGRTITAGDGDDVITADCIVTFFSDTNDGVYYSAQRHHINATSKSISIRAREPQGNFSWRLSHNGYESSIPPASLNSAPAAVIDSDIVQAIVTCFAASAGYYDLTGVRPSDAIRIDGRWYAPLQLPAAPGSQAKVTLFVLPDEGRIDLVRITSASGDKVVTAHSYNNRWLKAADRYVPTKIDVFMGPSAASQPARILQVNYQNFDMPE